MVDRCEFYNECPVMKTIGILPEEGMITFLTTKEQSNYYEASRQILRKFCNGKKERCPMYQHMVNSS